MSDYSQWKALDIIELVVWIILCVLLAIQPCANVRRFIEKFQMIFH